MMNCKLKFIDLFAGCGGLSLGLMNAGLEGIFAIEKTEDAFKTLIHNLDHKKIKNGYKWPIWLPQKNMTTRDLLDNYQSQLQELKDKVDLIAGGPPCQGFSVQRRGADEDPRNQLVFKYAQLVDELYPRYFVMENVPNLLTAEKGYFKKEIEEMFRKLGYVLNSDVLNAADYGVPQNRRRAVIIGKKSDDDSKKVALPKKMNDKVTIWDAISDLAYLESGEGENEQKYKLEAQSTYQKNMRKNSNSLFNHQATKHSKLAIERLKLLPPEMGKEVLPQEHLTKSIYSGTWSRMVKNDVSVTITTRFDTPSSGRFTHPYLNRAITVREAARIQSFPDSFVFTGTKSAQMKQVGNAVPPLLANAIAKAIKKDMGTEDENE